MTGESLTIVQDQLEKLKQLFPETITEGKIDWEKLQATLGKENIEFSNERYVLNWAGKSEAFKVLQQPTTATLKPCPGEGINDGFNSLSLGGLVPINREGRGEASENLFIEGENLEVLKVLQKSYYGKVKVVCIDPPYNTGNDSFIYPDSFKESREEYQKRIGEKDEEGYLMKEGFFRKNSKDSGHYHSNWLSMMYPRLFLAKNLLRDDGVIFVHIDDNEVHNLRMIMNEIFGEENFVAELVWKCRQNKDNRNLNGVSIDHEYVICYSKRNIRLRGDERKTEQYKNPDNDLRGDWTSGNMVGLLSEDLRPNCHYDLINTKTGTNYGKPKLGWRYDKNTMQRLIDEDRIIWPENENGRPRKKVFLNEFEDNFTGFSSLIGNNLFTRDGTKEIAELFENKLFDFPKPSLLLKQLVEQANLNSNDIVLDFFAGSASTAHAVLELNKEDGGNRKFILVQLPEPCDETSEAFKAGYKTIADISKERIRRVIKRLNSRQAGTSYDLPDSKMNMIEVKEAQQKLFAEEKNPDNQINRTNHGSDIGFKVFKLSPSNFKIWRGSEITDENLEQQLEMFTDPVREGSEKENMLYELILKAGYLLTDEIKVESNYYSVKNGELIIALEELNQEIIETIIFVKPKKVLTLDQLFTGNDQLKTNTVLQMKDAEIDFKTI